jgi:hypothetical protein
MSHTLEHMRMTAQLGNAYLNGKELSVMSGMALDEAQGLLNAYSLMGLLQVATETVVPVPVAPPPVETTRTGLFGRLRQKLGL